MVVEVVLGGFREDKSPVMLTQPLLCKGGVEHNLLLQVFQLQLVLVAQEM